ncbi:MAG: hypothetical protein JJ913_14975 [Rhizobiaceae bacterium]|nr:hypothetical protein [Rhizobiaceae bacterium]
MRLTTNPTGRRHGLARLSLPAVALALLAAPAWALSEIPEENIEAPPEIIQVPLPPPLGLPSDSPSVGAEDAGDAPEIEGADAPAQPLPEIYYDLELLPEPVRRMRQLIVDACRSGDIEALRPLLGSGDSATVITGSGSEIDPIDFLSEISGDGQGHEIMAILLEVLEAGYVHLDPGEPAEIYLWPYFFAVPLEGLSAPQRVELFKLVTAGDYEDMKSFGSYIFYRAGITPEGRWAFFLAGH